jgi:hypothetical protein
VATLNILYALACGCVTFAWHGQTLALHQASAEEIQEGFDHLEKGLVDLGGTGRDKDDIRRAFEMLRKHEFASRVHEFFQSESGRQATERLKDLGWAGMGLQAGFLLSGVLLFARVRIARAVALLCCGAAIVIHILTALAFQDLSAAAVRDLEPVLDEMAAQERGMEPLGHNAPSDMELATKILPFFAGGLTCIWPFIGLLILAFSQGIKRDLGLDLPAVLPR